MRPEKVGYIGRIFVYLLGKSWFISRLTSKTGLKRSPVLYTFWHGVQLPLIFTHKKMNINILISKSKDGELISSLCKKMGFLPIRGSSSKGGATAAKQLIEAMRLGYYAAITPDGPKGPPFLVKRGVSIIPKRAGVSVIPVGVRAFPAINLKSWDSFLIPPPFSFVTVAEGKPIAPKNCDEETLTAAINSETARARLHTCPFSVFQIAAIKTVINFVTPLIISVLFTRGKKERLERSGKIKTIFNAPVWLHGSSLGEINGLLPVIKLFQNANIPYFVTCTTPSARKFIEDQNIKGAYLPLDAPLFVNRFLNKLNPSALILAETEFWPVLLHETVTRGITAGLINGRLSPKSTKNYMVIRSLFRDTLGCFRYILTRTKEDSSRFLTLGVKTTPAGDSKTLIIPEAPKQAWKKMIKPSKLGILVAGSIRSGEVETILAIAKEAELTPVLVPRHAKRINDTIQLAYKYGFTPRLWTENPQNSDCLIVNTEGVLASLYGLASIAFVGGTFVPIGGHNIHEPLSHGIPIIVGSEYYHFTDIVKKAINRNICKVFTSVESGVIAVNELLLGNDKMKKISFSDTDFDSDSFLRELKKMLRLMEISI